MYISINAIQYAVHNKESKEIKICVDGTCFIVSKKNDIISIVEDILKKKKNFVKFWHETGEYFFNKNILKKVDIETKIDAKVIVSFKDCNLNLELNDWWEWKSLSKDLELIEIEK